jgi:hypothetical protein
VQILVGSVEGERPMSKRFENNKIKLAGRGFECMK